MRLFLVSVPIRVRLSSVLDAAACPGVTKNKGKRYVYIYIDVCLFYSVQMGCHLWGYLYKLVGESEQREALDGEYRPLSHPRHLTSLCYENSVVPRGEVVRDFVLF